MLVRRFLIGFLLLGASSARAESHGPVRDTITKVVARMTRELSTNELYNLTAAQAELFLTPKEREILSTEQLTFHVNVPVRVSILRDSELGEQPFWCAKLGSAYQD